MSKKLDRIASIEWLRVAASFGLVWFHTSVAAGREIGYAGLPIFIMLSIGLTAGKTHEEPLVSFFTKRARRLLIPWVFWSIVYFGYQIARESLKEASNSFPYGPAILLVGPSIHLWYLPFAFFASIPAYVLGKQLNGFSVSVRSLIFGGVAIASLVICSYGLSVKGLLVVPFTQWAFGFPAVLLGLAIGPLALEGSKRHRYLILMSLAGLVIILCVALYSIDQKSMAIPYAIGVPLVIGCFLWQKTAGAWAVAAGSLTYGIYILHPLVGGILSFAGLKTSVWPLRVVLVFLVSALATALIRRTLLRRFL